MSERQESDSDVGQILRTLRLIFKNRGVRYSDVARSLKVSEATVKRYMSGCGLSVRVLERLCRLVGLRLWELSEIVMADQDSKLRSLTLEQEQELADDPLTAFVFYMLRCGSHPAEIQAEFRIDEAEMVLALSHLDRMRLIDLLPRNRIRLLTDRNPEWRIGGPMRKLFDRNVKEEFASLDYRDPRVMWDIRTLKLSNASLIRLKEMIDEFTREALSLAEKDRRATPAKMGWHSVVVAAGPISARRILRNRSTGARTDIAGGVAADAAVAPTGAAKRSLSTA